MCEKVMIPAGQLPHWTVACVLQELSWAANRHAISCEIAGQVALGTAAAHSQIRPWLPAKRLNPGLGIAKGFVAVKAAVHGQTCTAE